MCPALTTVPVPVSVPPVAVESSGRSDLHLQLFALGGVGRHGVAVVRPEATLSLRPHRLRQLIGCVRAGAPAAQSGVLKGRGEDKGNGCQSNGHVAIATDEEGHNSKEEKKVNMTRAREKSQLVHSQS